MVSPREVFDRMQRYRKERNELREKIVKLQHLPKKVFKLEQKVAQLEKKLEESSSINVDKLRNELLMELEDKIENFFNSSVEKALMPVENEIYLTYMEDLKSAIQSGENKDTVRE